MSTRTQRQRIASSSTYHRRSLGYRPLGGSIRPHLQEEHPSRFSEHTTARIQYQATYRSCMRIAQQPSVAPAGQTCRTSSYCKVAVASSLRKGLVLALEFPHPNTMRVLQEGYVTRDRGTRWLYVESARVRNEASLAATAGKTPP